MEGSVIQPHRKMHVVLLRMLYGIIIGIVLLYVILTYLQVLPTTLIGEAIVTAVFGIGIVEVLARIVYYYYINNIHKAEAKTLSDITRIIGFSVLLLTVLYIIFGYQYLGGILVSAGFLGIVIGLAAQSTISNFIAGMYLLASNVVEPNDNVIIHTWQYTFQPQSYPHDRYVPGLSGIIESIGVLYTKIVNDDGIPVYVPNNIVAQALVINYHRAKEHTRKIQFDVDITVPFNKLEKIIDKVMKESNIEAYNIKLEYLHQLLYVVTIHVKAQEKDIRVLKSAIFGEIINEINSEKGSKKQKTLKSA